MSSKIVPGEYVGVIQEHGVEQAFGKSTVFFMVRVDDGEHVEVVRCRFFLEGSDEKKTETAIRMARAGLKLCGFDPDAQELDDLNAFPELLKGNEVPIRAIERESNGKFYMNFDIAPPRKLDPERARSLTSLLRAAKSENEAPIAPQKTPELSVPTDPEERRKLREKLDAEQAALKADIPF